MVGGVDVVVLVLLPLLLLLVVMCCRMLVDVGANFGMRTGSIVLDSHVLFY